LRSQLREQLSYVESVAKGFTPDTLEEATALEKKLTEALAEVKQMKSRLAKR
jgi:hypothetical protein